MDRCTGERWLLFQMQRSAFVMSLMRGVEGWVLRSTTALETVHLQLVLVHQTFLQEESANVVSLITLQLDDGSAQVRILADATVTVELFLELFQDLLEVQLCRKTLDSGNRLLAVSLGYTYMNVTRTLAEVVVFGVGEWVLCGKIDWFTQVGHKTCQLAPLRVYCCDWLYRNVCSLLEV